MSTREADPYAQKPEIFKVRASSTRLPLVQEMCCVCYSFNRGFLWTSDAMIFWENRKEKWFLPRSSSLAISPSFPQQEQGKWLHKAQRFIQLKQACASPWCEAGCSALTASHHLPTQPPSCLLQPSLQIWHAVPETKQVFPSHPQDLPPKIICPHILEAVRCAPKLRIIES